MNAKIDIQPIDSLIPYATNSRTHSDAQIAQIAASIREFGWTNPVLIRDDLTIIAGHGRVLAARKLGQDSVPCIKLSHLTDAQVRAYVIADNKLALNAGWDEALLESELDALKEMGFDISLTGFSDEELSSIASGEDLKDTANGRLSEQFLIAPFSVLNAREGWWQDRKKNWLATGLRSEVGRGDNLLRFSETVTLKKKGSNESKTKFGKTFEAIDDKVQLDGLNATSIFDPVLCEIAYRWFCPKGGIVLDPFAGGSVRGIVASKLGLRYHGQDLRAEQVEANAAQGIELCKENEVIPAWVCGDSRNIDKTWPGLEADFILSCPPYADLEVYSDNPADISTLGYDEFRTAYFEIIAKACSLLKNDRFACWVVGEVRDKKGNYHDFIGDTVDAFKAAGLHYYNEAILVTAVGSLPIRAGRTFSSSRKLGKTHQNVLVFVKGDGKKAAKACGDLGVDIEAALAPIEESAAIGDEAPQA